MTQKNLELNDVSALDFTTFCTRIAEAYSNDTSSVDGSILAYFAKRLIAAEVQPGGPYTDEHGRLTVQLNAAIGCIFLLMGKPLPNVDAYLSKALDDISEADRAALNHYKSTQNNMLYSANNSRKQPIPYRRAAKTLSTLSEPIKTQALQFLTRIEVADTTGEIAAISQFTQHALTNTSISSAKLNILGEANIHCWIAYTIYDHILDKDADATLLPAANICMRIALKLYQQTLPMRHPLQSLIVHYFDQVDVTSAWEVSSCRLHISEGLIHVSTLPDYRHHEMLAWRSCIHILGPLIVAASSPSITSEQRQQFTEGLHHYLVARQLGDDIHDWREDLVTGRISAVVALLLERQNVQKDSTYNLDELVAAIQKDFLDEGAITISELILLHTKQAYAKLVTAGCEPSSEIIGLVLRLKRMATESVRQQHRFVSFQSEYSKE